MTRDHALIEELLSIHALGGLDGADVERLERERAAHGDCEECRRLEAGFGETAGWLASALDPEPVDAAMADRILGVDRPSTPPAPVPAPPDDLGKRRRRSGERRWRAVAGIAAAMLVLVGAFAVITRHSPTAPTLRSDQRVVRFTAPPGSTAQLSIAYTPGRSGAVLWGTGMPDPGRGKVYEIWTITRDNAVSGGCVRPTDGAVAAYVHVDVGSADQMAVTLESASCPGSPTTAPVMTASLQV